MILAAALTALHLLPAPAAIAVHACRPFTFTRALRARGLDAGAIEEIDERWRALGIPQLRAGANEDIRVTRIAGAPQSYRLRIDGSRVEIAAADADGVFYAAMTLAQLPVRHGSHWGLPCVAIGDAPAMRWRILSDDISRGALPTMRYFEERIRTIAAFKMNGYAPYMEHVFRVPTDPLPAPLDGLTPSELRELAQYAARFHVAFIPQQQSFAHMHNTLKYERYAGAAEQPHAFLLSPASPLSLPYMRRVIGAELAAVPHPPFFHIGSDETSALGQGQSKALAQKVGLSQLYAQHVQAMTAIIKPSGARVMIWDDGIENDHAIMHLIPRSTVVVNWHYQKEASFAPYIDLLSGGGFDQMVDPGDSNWNQIYPDIENALGVEDRFITQGKSAHVLGLFESTWNDDGQALFEATWYPVLYAAASAWERNSVSHARFLSDFPHAFFGSDDARYAQDIRDLTAAQQRFRMYGFTSDAMLWADPFDPLYAGFAAASDVGGMRLAAENAEQHLLLHHPPLHANAASVMFLAAREFDALGRNFQAAHEIRDVYYGTGDRGMLWSKYWFWEMRDAYEELAPLYAAAWRYEDRESHLASNLERFHVAAQLNIERAGRVERATITSDNKQPLTPFAEIVKR